MQTDWNWEEFDAGPMIKDAERIHVTINRRGYFYLNGRAIKAMGEPDAVALFYDRRMQTIGIKRAPLTKRNAYRLKMKDGDRVTGECSTPAISAATTTFAQNKHSPSSTPRSTTTDY